MILCMRFDDKFMRWQKTAMIALNVVLARRSEPGPPFQMHRFDVADTPATYSANEDI